MRPVDVRSLPESPRRVERPGMLARLCKRCGGYCGAQRDFCMPCIDRLNKTCPLKRDYWTIKDRTVPDKRKHHKKINEQQHQGDYCVDCKVSMKQNTSDLCLICDAKRRDKLKEKNISVHYKNFGNGEVIRSMEKDNDWRCIVCKSRNRQKEKKMCHGCEIKQSRNVNQVNAIFDYNLEVEKNIKNAERIKERHTSSEEKEEKEKEIKVIKESLQRILDKLDHLKPSKRQEKDKLQMANTAIQQALDKVTHHDSMQSKDALNTSEPAETKE